jgi:membrane-associated protease RseP (regulator of RpoE activity)
MNHRILATSLSTLFVVANFTLAQSADLEKPAPDQKSDPSATLKISPGDTKKKWYGTTVVTDGGKGKATITIDINGKKEIREIDLGNATEIKIQTDDKDTAKSKLVTFLGVAPEELSEELASQLPIDPGSGLLVRSIIPDSPATAAGILKNDVLIKLDDQVLTSPKQLQKLVASRKAGETIRVTYLRRGQRAEVEAKLSEHEDTSSPKYDVLLGALGGKRVGDSAPVRVPFDPLTFQKKIVIVDKEGNVVSKDDSEDEHAAAIKRLAGEVEKMRDQAAAAQKQAQEAIRHAEYAAREAGEIAKKEATVAVERMRETVRKLQEQLEKQAGAEKKAQP